MNTRIKSATIENLLKSFALSVFLCLGWGALSLLRVRQLSTHFELIECLWLAYNVLISFLFLIRRRPSVVSMDAIHWMIAVLTSFSGFFFSKLAEGPSRVLTVSGDIMIVVGLLMGIAAAGVLGRNYDVLPALRGVSTSLVYRMVRHPMYLSSVLIKLGYVARHPSGVNAGLFVLVAILYVKRAEYEEETMMADARYIEYMERVRYRFIPGLF